MRASRATSHHAPASPRFPHDLTATVEHYIRALAFTPTSVRGLLDAMNYSLLSGGKRVRPVLALATARAIGEDPARVLPIAAAIELIHTFSLIHDDLPSMDDDDVRRGRPACHKAFGEGVAILAGDALYAEAFRHVLTHQQGEPSAVLAAVRELANATGIDGMVGGQYLDITGSTLPDGNELRTLHLLKTGRLISAAVVCPLLVCEAPPERVDALRTFSEELGVLFQIADDILDADRTTSRQENAELSRQSYVAAFGLSQARAMAAASHQKALEALAAALPQSAGDLEALTTFFLERQA